MALATTDPVRASARVSRELREDLLTDWIPDPVGGCGIPTDPQAPKVEDINLISVATRTGRREVPAPSIEFRAWSAWQLGNSLDATERVMPPWVYGYRDALTPYRSEWARFGIDQIRLESEFPHRERVDVRDFYRRVGPDLLASALSPNALEITGTAHRLYGQYLLPGHRASRRLANVVLNSLEQSIAFDLSDRVLRWQDDYWVFGRTAGDVDSTVLELQRALAQGGLEVSRSKFTNDQVPAPLPAPETAVDAFRATSVAQREGNVAALKYLLRWFTERRIAAQLPLFAAAAQANPVLVPRFAALIAACPSEAEATHALIEGLASADRWTTCRLVAAAGHHPALSNVVPLTVLDQMAGDRAPAIRGLAARIQRTRGLTQVRANDRIDSVINAASPSGLADCAPLVETTL